MKTIGFIDYFLSEWHANNYPEWIKNAGAVSGEEFVVKYAWAEIDRSPYDGVTTDEWCEKYGAIKCASIEELCEKSDYIVVLSPANPEKHLEYAKAVFPFNKNTYIDKTFAPDFKSSEEIFALSKKYNTKFFSTSALRCATELEELINSDTVTITGGGSNYDEYIVHQIEMAVKTINRKAIKVRLEAQGQDKYTSTVQFENGGLATMFFAPENGFTITAEKDNEKYYKEIQSDFFKFLIGDMLKFFADGKQPFDSEQTREVMKIRSALCSAKDKPCEWIEL